MSFDNFKTVDLDDLILHSLGATQQLVKVTFQIEDKLNAYKRPGSKGFGK